MKMIINYCDFTNLYSMCVCVVLNLILTKSFNVDLLFALILVRLGEGVTHMVPDSMGTMCN